MKDLLVAIASLVVLVGGMFLFAASFGLVEDLWDALIGAASRRLPATPPPTPDPESRNADPPMTDHDEPTRREELARHLAAAEEALSEIEGEAYGAHVVCSGIEDRARALDAQAAELRADAEERLSRAALYESGLPELQEAVRELLPWHVKALRRWNAGTRRGRPVRYSPEGHRILDYFDEYSLQRAMLRVTRVQAIIEANRTAADALVGAALRVEASARSYREDHARSLERVERLRENERAAQVRYDGLKAELEAAGGPPEPPAD